MHGDEHTRRRPNIAAVAASVTTSWSATMVNTRATNPSRTDRSAKAAAYSASASDSGS